MLLPAFVLMTLVSLPVLAILDQVLQTLIAALKFDQAILFTITALWETVCLIM
jgi:hypothetical protein